ncbi:MAG: ribbon-helix-helix domain-containing protein [Oscillospiraceae bacterium]|nr:ribbon-helix-helix domain-containing protein [Oscillospiraceae bacterium]
MGNSIYSLVLSDEVVDAVDALAHGNGLSRSAMINRILAERVAMTTPEMRLQEILEAVRGAMDDCFVLTEMPGSGTLCARSSLKYRYKPTARYSVEIYSRNGKKAGEIRVSFRTQNAELIEALGRFFECWIELEKKYISRALSDDIVFTINAGKFTRTLNMPRENISDDALGEAVADYMAMIDGTMKEYFGALPDENEARAAAENYYKTAIEKQKFII